MSKRCAAMTNSDQPCRAWAVVDTEPPLCAAHSGGASPDRGDSPCRDSRPGGAVPGNQNAVKHGFYRRPARPLETIADALEHLTESLIQLAEYLAEHMDELTVDEITRLQAVRGQNLSRFVRMIRDKAAMEGEGAADFAAGLEEAHRMAAQVLGLEIKR